MNRGQYGESIKAQCQATRMNCKYRFLHLLTAIELRCYDHFSSAVSVVPQQHAEGLKISSTFNIGATVQLENSSDSMRGLLPYRAEICYSGPVCS